MLDGPIDSRVAHSPIPLTTISNRPILHGPRSTRPSRYPIMAAQLNGSGLSSRFILYILRRQPDLLSSLTPPLVTSDRPFAQTKSQHETHPVVDTLGLPPGLLDTMVPVRLVSLEHLCALLDDGDRGGHFWSSGVEG